jgi:hypothetical protein
MVMSKLVIWTQYKENYGAHDWDGKGECPQYWKFKGGDTYVVRNLSTAQINKIAQEGIPTLTDLIEYRSEASEEYILGWEIVEDSAKECEDWDTVTEFVWKMDRWICQRFTNNDEFGYMRREILAKSESWIPLPQAERSDYKCEFKTAKGWFTGEQLSQELEAA